MAPARNMVVKTLPTLEVKKPPFRVFEHLAQQITGGSLTAYLGTSNRRIL
jgi:hypothetical protein